MNILILSQYFFPEQFRINDIAAELVRRKHKVTVLTGLPNYPEGEIYEGYENAFWDVSAYRGAALYRCRLRPRHSGKINLMLNYLSFVVEAAGKLRKLPADFDVIYVYGLSPITSAIPAIWYGRKHRIPIYYYCMDLWPDSVLDEGTPVQEQKKSPVFAAAKLLSTYVYKHVSLISNKCEAFIPYIREECGISPDKMTVLYEHAENDYLSVSEKPTDNGIIDFMFLGNIGTAQNCELLLEAFSRTTYAGKAKLHFVGDGSCAEKLKNRVKEKHLEEDVIFHGKHPLSEIGQFYNLADVCLLSLSGTTAAGMTPPGKLYGYLAAARPIVAAIGAPSREIIEKANCGFAVPDGDVAGLTAVMQKIMDTPAVLNGLGENGRSYFLENYTLDKHITKLERQLQALAAAAGEKKARGGS